MKVMARNAEEKALQDAVEVEEKAKTDAASKIQAAFRGHLERKVLVLRAVLEEASSSDDFSGSEDERDLLILGKSKVPPKHRSTSCQRQNVKQSTLLSDSSDSDEDTIG